jgi:hypothetical protein
MANASRRVFFKKLVSLTGAALLAPHLIGSIAGAEEKRRAKKDAGGATETGDLAFPFVDPSKDTGAALKYHHKNSEVKDAALKIERNGVPFDKQTCATCMLYTGVGKKGSDEVGKCALFPNHLVKSTGWCMSWQKKV